MFNWLKKTADKADTAIEQVSKDMSETAGKVQEVLDESNKSVNVIINVVLVTLGVSILGNIINIGLSISRHKQMNVPSKIVIQNLYLGVPKGPKNE